MKNLKHLFTALLLLCATAVAAHDFEVGGIYYNILSETDKTVEVYKGTYLGEYSGSVVIPETVTVSETGTNVLKTFDAWTSTNKGNGGTTSQTSYTLNVEAGNILKFDWSVSSESSFDWLIITLDGTEIVKKSGTLSGSYEKTFDTAGSHTLVVKYTKDGSVNNGNDEGKIFNVTLNALNGDVAVDVEYRVTSIGWRAFIGCTGLTSITIPNSVTSIGESAFYDCTGLTSIEIPNSVTSIGNAAFRGCTGLTSVVFGNKNIYLGELVFAGCKNIKYFVRVSSEEAMTAMITNENYSDTRILTGNMVIPENVTCNGKSYKVTSIGGSAFSGCTGLTSIEIPNSVTSIGGSAFSGCTGLTSVTIPNSVTSIDAYAFDGCSGLTSIEIPNSVTSIGLWAFGGTAWYNNQPDGVVYAGKVLYKYKGSMPLYTSITIKEGTLGIASCAFFECYGLTSITIPNSVTSIGIQAFQFCYSLTNIEIPNSVTTIRENAFYECGLTSIEIPNSVTSIGENAFANCTWLTSIEIPNSVTSIGNNAFSGCTGLTSVTSLIPADELFAINSYVFNSADKTTCTLYVPYGAKDTYAATAGWSEFTNIVELEPTATEVTVTIGQYGNATYCSPYALDFSEVDGLKAYAATGYKSNSQVVTLTRVQTAEAGIGLFLKGEPGEYVVPVIESTDEHSLNMLVGTLEQTTVNSTDGAMSNYKFTIADGDTAPMFYPFEDNTAFSAGKAYLQIPTAWLPATAQKSLSVRFDDGETTDIDELKGESGEVKTIYDLQGCVVENPTSGIYIIDGKKIFVK